jgi:hypothetical protein
MAKPFPSTPAGASTSQPPGPLVAALEALRQASADHLRRHEVPAARAQLRRTLRETVVTPLFGRADAETDPVRRLRWIVLASCSQKYLSLEFGSAPPPTAEAGGSPTDSTVQLMQLANLIETYSRNLTDELPHL